MLNGEKRVWPNSNKENQLSRPRSQSTVRNSITPSLLIKTLNAGNQTTQNKTQAVLLIAGSCFVEMLVPDVTVTCK